MFSRSTLGTVHVVVMLSELDRTPRLPGVKTETSGTIQPTIAIRDHSLAERRKSHDKNAIAFLLADHRAFKPFKEVERHRATCHAACMYALTTAVARNVLNRNANATPIALAPL